MEHSTNKEFPSILYFILDSKNFVTDQLQAINVFVVCH